MVTEKKKTKSTSTRKKVTVKKKTTTTKKVKSKFYDSEFDITQHILVPKHTILSDKEKEKLFQTYNISDKELPKILLTDPAIRHLKPKLGDVVRIDRISPTAGKAIFYRGVANE